MIPLCVPYLPDKEKYKSYIDRIYDSAWLTNNGRLVRELENRLRQHLGVRNLICVSNGTTALQVAFKALGLKGSVITSPFSFVATSSSLLWQGLKPVFTDIESGSFNIDPRRIEAVITPDTSAILPVHVFGNPCDVEAIENIANTHDLKVIYDASHAFGVECRISNGQQKSILNYGDVSTISFHATKLFHSIEGGAIVTNDDTLASEIRAMINFGFSGGEISLLGINAKMNEFEAAMGLCVLDDIEAIARERKRVWERYACEFSGRLATQNWSSVATRNYGYAPFLFESEEVVLGVIERLEKRQITARRYFFPSLNRLNFLDTTSAVPIAENIASRILCLPIFPTLTDTEQAQVIEEILLSLN